MEQDHFQIQLKFYMANGFDQIAASYMSTYSYGLYDQSDRTSMKCVLNDLYRQYTLRYIKKHYDQDLIGDICQLIRNYFDGDTAISQHGNILISQKQMQSRIALLVLQNE